MSNGLRELGFVLFFFFCFGEIFDKGRVDVFVSGYKIKVKVRVLVEVKFVIVEVEFVFVVVFFEFSRYVIVSSFFEGRFENDLS